MNRLTIYTHPCALEHDTGPGHAERPDRLRAVYELLDSPEFAALSRAEAQKATPEQLARAHERRYIDSVAAAIPDNEGEHVMLDEDTVVSAGSWEAAMRAAGAVCQAVDDIAAGRTLRGFCAMRPPGHHAEPGKAMGFCLFNNIFVGARHAQEKHGVEKVAIIDFDVHHGNGTDAMTRSMTAAAQPLFFASSHQSPLYPGTGLPTNNIEGKILNVVLEPDSDSYSFRNAYTEKIIPEVNSFAPDLLLISAGFDAHRDDSLAQLNLEDTDYDWVTRQLAAVADRHTDGKIVSVLEGGYNLNALKKSLAAHLRALQES